MSGTHWILVLLTIAALSLGGQLLLSDDGYRKTRTLRLAVEAQRRVEDVGIIDNFAESCKEKLLCRPG